MGPSGGGCARAGPTPPSEARSHTSAAASVFVTALSTKVDPEPGDANRVNPSNRSEATPGAPARGFPDNWFLARKCGLMYVYVGVGRVGRHGSGMPDRCRPPAPASPQQYKEVNRDAARCTRYRCTRYKGRRRPDGPE